MYPEEELKKGLEESRERERERSRLILGREWIARSVDAWGEGGRIKEKYGFFKFLTGRESRSLRLRPLIFERGGSGGADIG